MLITDFDTRRQPHTVRSRMALQKELIRTITERARTMLIDAGLPKRFWAEAVSTAVYLINRSSILNNNIPEKLWTRRKFSIRHLRIFGCKALALIPKERRDK